MADGRQLGRCDGQMDGWTHKLNNETRGRKNFEKRDVRLAAPPCGNADRHRNRPGASGDMRS